MLRRHALFLAGFTGALLLGGSGAAQAHCQVPCGIFDDHARVHAMREDVTTITKALKEMAALSGKKDAQSLNQLVRWVNTKEAHAERIMRTISDYFLAQKIAPPAAKADAKTQAVYLERLAKHHAVMVAAMKCKQSASDEPLKALSKALDAIEGYWPVATIKPAR
jgi:nickel superoxide dismutase